MSVYFYNLDQHFGDISKKVLDHFFDLDVVLDNHTGSGVLLPVFSQFLGGVVLPDRVDLVLLHDSCDYKGYEICQTIGLAIVIRAWRLAITKQFGSNRVVKWGESLVGLHKIDGLVGELQELIWRSGL